MAHSYLIAGCGYIGSALGDFLRRQGHAVTGLTRSPVSARLLSECNGWPVRAADLTDPDCFPVFTAGRGGQYTCHGPGQRVIYTMLDVKARGGDVRCFVRDLERWVIDTLAEFNVTGEIRDGRVGVWVQRPDRPGPDGKPGEDKIAAIGIKLRRWVSFHGISINVEPDLSHFDGIVPCGIRDHGVTSLVDLGLPVTMADLDAALIATFPRRFQGLCPTPDAA